MQFTGCAWPEFCGMACTAFQPHIGDLRGLRGRLPLIGLAVGGGLTRVIGSVADYAAAAAVPATAGFSTDGGSRQRLCSVRMA